MIAGVITKYLPQDGYGLIVDDEGHEHFFYSRDVEKHFRREIKKGERIDFDPSLWNHFHAVHLTPEHAECVRKIKQKDNNNV